MTEDGVQGPGGATEEPRVLDRSKRGNLKGSCHCEYRDSAPARSRVRRPRGHHTGMVSPTTLTQHMCEPPLEVRTQKAIRGVSGKD